MPRLLSLTAFTLLAITAIQTTWAYNCTDDSDCNPNGCCPYSSQECTTNPPPRCLMPCTTGCTTDSPFCHGYGCGCDRTTGQCFLKASSSTGATTTTVPATLPPSGRCATDDDCFPTSCCHANACAAQPTGPCTTICTHMCMPDTMDCGQGSCGCDVKTGQCRVNWNTDAPQTTASPSSEAALHSSSSDLSMPVWSVALLATATGVLLFVVVGCSVRWILESSRSSRCGADRPEPPQQQLSASAVEMTASPNATYLLRELYTCSQPPQS